MIVLGILSSQSLSFPVFTLMGCCWLYKGSPLLNFWRRVIETFSESQSFKALKCVRYTEILLDSKK